MRATKAIDEGVGQIIHRDDGFSIIWPRPVDVPPGYDLQVRVDPPEAATPPAWACYRVVPGDGLYAWYLRCQWAVRCRWDRWIWRRSV